MELVAREGAEAPGSSGSEFDSFFDISITDAVGEGGEVVVVFGAILRNDILPLNATEDTAYYSYRVSAGELELLVLEGEVAPGTPAVYRALTSLSVHRGGDFAFNGLLRRGVGGVTRTNESGVWCGSASTGSTSLLVRGGDMLTDAEGAERTIRRPFISEPFGGGTAGRSSAVSYGNVVVLATYESNGTASVLVLGKPSPGDTDTDG